MGYIKTFCLAIVCWMWALIVALSTGCRTVNKIPPIDLTRTRLSVTINRIEKYWEKHNQLPAGPEQLPVEMNRDCSMTDGWGHELHWKYDGKSKIQVQSLGRDGIPGGEGDDADIEMVFDVAAVAENKG